MSNLSSLEKSVLKTISYFDVFDHPLTLMEVYKWLYQPDQKYSLHQVSQVLNSEAFKSYISHKYGFYFLLNRDDIVRTRLNRYSIAEKKFRRALKTVKFLRFIAFIKMIAVCNNVGYNNGSKDSDIDFFIIVSKGRLWWARLVITLVTTLLGVRRHGNKIVDRVCLSFYTADNHLNLDDISLKPLDPYLIYWFATLAPIYDRDNTYHKFMSANSWLKEYLPNFYLTNLSLRRSVSDSKLISFLRNIDKAILSTRLGDFLENVSKVVELKKIKVYFGSSPSESNTNVVMTDDMLKLHKTDRREKYKKLWEEKINHLGL